jgi:hypothetical protein
MYCHGDDKTGEIEEERQISLRFQAAELVDYDGEENAYTKPDNKAKGAFLWARWRKDSGVENRSDRNGFLQVSHPDAWYQSADIPVFGRRMVAFGIPSRSLSMAGQCTSRGIALRTITGSSVPPGFAEIY